MDSTVLRLAVVAKAEVAASMEAHNDEANDFDEEQVDEDTVVDTPLAHGERDAGLVSPPSFVSPTVCRFASHQWCFKDRGSPPTTDIASHRQTSNSRGVSHSRQVALRRPPAESGCPAQAGGAKLPASP
jgi:hypothetical protein